MRTMKLAALSAVAFAAMAQTAWAGGFSIREQSVIGQGMSFAGVAAGSAGLSSIFWNPAVSSEYNEFGFISESNVAGILPYARTDGDSALRLDSGNVGRNAIVPASYYSYAINDQLTIAASLNAPAGLITNGDNSWLGARFGDYSQVTTYNFNPSASYKINDMVSVGIGAQIEYMSAKLTNTHPISGANLLDAEGDSIGVGFTAGLLFKPTDSTDIGIGFRSSISHELEGDLYYILMGNTSFKSDYASPELVTIGIRQQVNDQLALTAGFEWSNWSRFKSLDIVAPGGTLSEAINFKDSWMVSAGAEYLATDKLMVRAGIAYEDSPVTDGSRGVRLPDADRLWLSLGGSYKISDTMTAHLAYSHVFMDDGPIFAATGLPTEYKQHLDIVSLGLTHDW